MTVEILMIRLPKTSPVAELTDPANADVRALIDGVSIGKERHTILTVSSDNAPAVLERVSAFTSVLRAYVCA